MSDEPREDVVQAIRLIAERDVSVSQHGNQLSELRTEVRLLEERTDNLKEKVLLHESALSGRHGLATRMSQLESAVATMSKLWDEERKERAEERNEHRKERRQFLWGLATTLFAVVLSTLANLFGG